MKNWIQIDLYENGSRLHLGEFNIDKNLTKFLVNLEYKSPIKLKKLLKKNFKRIKK